MPVTTANGLSIYFANDAAALMADQGWDAANVIGVSFGGMVGFLNG